MSNQLIDKSKVRNIWLDENNHIGIVEIDNDILGVTFHPIEVSEVWCRDRYSIIDYMCFMSYSGARRSVEAYITGRLSKRDIKELE